MCFCECFASELLGLDVDTVRWTENYRSGLREHFGVPPESQVPEKLICENMSGDGIGDNYHYQFALKNIQVGFGQTIYNSIPLSNEQYLLFYYGRTNKLDAPGAALIYDQLFEAKFRFRTGEYEARGDYWVNLESQNLGIYNDHGWGPLVLTSKGKKIINDLLLYENNLRHIQGLKAVDHSKLVKMLNRIRHKYKIGELNVFCWPI